MSSEVRIVRLSTGEEIIGNVIGNGTNITIEKPFIMIATGEGKISFGTYLPYNEDDFVCVDINHVMFTLKPVPQMVEQYAAMVGQVYVPEKKIIV